MQIVDILLAIFHFLAFRKIASSSSGETRLRRTYQRDGQDEDEPKAIIVMPGPLDLALSAP